MVFIVNDFNNENIYIFLKFVFAGIFLFNYILRGLAYKRLDFGYYGFVPIFGDVICMDKVADKFENKYRKRYRFWAYISKFAIPVIICIVQGMIVLFAGFLIIGFAENPKSPMDNFLSNLNFFTVFIIFLFISIIIFNILSIFLNFYYRYKIFEDFIYFLSETDKNILNAVLFSLFPFLFYIWTIKICNSKK